MQRQEECVSGMEQQLRGVVMKDAPILFSKEEFVSDMVQNLRGAQVKRYTFSHEGCTNIVQRGVCIRHGAQVKKPNSCTYEGCNLLLFDTKYS